MFDTISQRELGPYAVHELIGWSGLSRVYRATDTSSTETEVAIKVLRNSIISDGKCVQRFIREIKIAGMLKHPHILATLNSGRERGVLFMIMPLVEGGTLADILQLGNPLSPRQTLIIAEQIGAALDYIHSFRMVHCDIKPANILLSDKDLYMLADFGLVRHVDEQGEMNSNNSVTGTPMYMSPEQMRGEALDHRSDLYSLGLVLYECLTGRLPYNTHSPVESMSFHANIPPISPCQINRHFPACLAAPLLRGIEKDRALRFQSGREMTEELNGAIEKLGYEDSHRPLVLQEEINESTRRISV